MADFITSPGVALLVLAILALEAIAFFALWSKSRRGLSPAQIAGFLGAGAGFALCLYGALADMGAVWIGATLTFAFVFHLFDLAQRWR